MTVQRDMGLHSFRAKGFLPDELALTLWKVSGVLTWAEVWLPREEIMTRYGMLTGLKAEQVERYKKLHAAVWPGVLKTIKECKIQNYSIFLKDTGRQQYFLFGYFEYTGDDYEADMAKMAADPTTQEWCAPLQTVPAAARMCR